MTTRYRFTRKELYDLVWAEPMRTLAARYDISDSGFAKRCRQNGIPLPDRGHWAKLKAGKKIFQKPLPPRAPGMPDEIILKKDRYGGYDSPTDEELLANDPVPPTFDEEMESVTSRIEKEVPRIPFPRNLKTPHPLIQRLLDKDEELRQKQKESSYLSSFYAPRFESPAAKRRLKILSALFSALTRFGAKPWARGDDAEETGAAVGEENVRFSLEYSKGKSKRLKLEIPGWWDKPGTEVVWEDDDEKPLENQLREIAVQLIVRGELHYRAFRLRHHAWLLKRKAAVIEERRQAKEEEERLARERKIAEEKARIDRLLGEADALRQADVIRDYVAQVRARHSAENPGARAELETWSSWAHAQADRIDPVKSGRFLSR